MVIVRYSWIRQGVKVFVGYSIGTVVRVVELEDDLYVDVEIAGVIDRYSADQIESIDEEFIGHAWHPLGI